ncbi:chaplin family protein [Streptomonospora wellingtoniae]|uniref:Chaplin family protein n=1 Tax=Streptomonospora wellingtoniae TaxID=3075544 RepID=A0ABU2KZR8_9ACTN|nr:chaplin family protein [Streptomonospora sp. DSM 45055]MDT0304770.1 chaplin family protein [Streptomonospora sp. DSM 45055]
MRKHLSTSVSATLLAVGLVGAAPATAFAGPETDGSGGVASGNQINVPADVEAELCGNALSVLGISQADCTRVSEILYAASDEGQSSPQTDGSNGAAAGNQINMPVDAAVDICGNSAAIGGISKADCTTVVNKLADESEGGGSPQTDGSSGVASGNQINIPVDVALDVCGNSIDVLGASEAECTTVVKAVEKSSDDEGSEGGGSPQTDGSSGVASGNQVNVPVDAAVDICGNAVGVLGVAEGECLEKISHDEGGDEPGDDGEDGGDEPGDDGEDGGDEPGDDGEDGGDKPGDDGDEAPSPEQPGEDSTPDDKNAPEGSDTGASGGLPLTGPALGGLVAAAVAAIGGGGAAMAFSRRRKAAAAVADDDAAGAEE